MIIRVSVENWMSFRNKVELSMVASRELQHSDRVPKLSKYQTRVLPIAAVYGGNASGKTNFFKALYFAKELVVRGTQPEALIPVEPFRLDAAGADEPVQMTFELLIEGTIYDFSFSVTKDKVLEERLVKITSTSERELYHRRAGTLNLNAALSKEQFLRFAFKGTRDNQLYLTNAVSQKVDTFKPVYDWFKDTLELVAPDSRFGQLHLYLDEKQPQFASMNAMISQLDTGIAHLGGENVSFEHAPFPDFLKKQLLAELKEGDTVGISGPHFDERYAVTRTGGGLTAKKLVAYHPMSDGTEAKFEIHQESDGSQRVIELLPAFLDLSAQSSSKVYVIDELDRSLHTLLTRRLLESYLSHCSAESRAQLLFTTHDVMLMDQDLFRRDEMWVAERDRSGVSKLISFSEYKDVRNDKDIRKSYLQGRLGGVPRIVAPGVLMPSARWECEVAE
jgi:AAA15 family ATPase/GTPase